MSEPCQLNLPIDIPEKPRFPSTRYQGSKQKFIDWIWNCISPIKFNSVLDAFGGTGCFAYRAKLAGKEVVYNDILPFNAIIGQALIENPGIKLEGDDVNRLLDLNAAAKAPDFIARTFHDVYYTDDENAWLDKVSFNIRNTKNLYKRSLAYFALFQSCICKRPYNLFHRKNLYVRQSDVQRTFGNKKTWDTPFDVHFRKFVIEANRAVFDSGKKCRSICYDAFKLSGDFDLVYIDTPYVSSEGKGVDYAAFYHFLNGISDYDSWPSRIDYSTKHLKLKTDYNVWTDRNFIHEAFAELFRHYNRSILAVSYRSNGVPSIDAIVEMLRKTHSDVKVFTGMEMKYALSKTSSREVLLLATPLV